MNIIKIMSCLILCIIYVPKINYTYMFLKSNEEINFKKALKGKIGWLITIPIATLFVICILHRYSQGYVVWIDLIITLVLMALVDVKHHIIPNQLNLLLFLSFICTSIMIELPYNLLYIIAFIVIILVLYLISKVTNEQIGMGDVKLIAIITLFAGGAFTIYTMLFSMIIMLLYSIPLMIAKKLNLKSQLPFVPFYTFGTVIFLIFNLI